MTPFLEQIHGSVDEGTGKTWAFHGYWTRDWTAVEPTLGTRDDLRAFVDAAHARGIRVVMDAIINHTGPVTPLDPQWPDDWVRTAPRCTYETYPTTVPCTLVDNLPDDATWDDLMRKTCVRQTIEKGLADSREGRTRDVKEVRARYGLSS